MFVILFVDCNNEGPYYRQTQLVYRAYFIILYNDQQIHKIFTGYHTPTCFDTIMSSSESL
jgi:hypothetical protein